MYKQMKRWLCLILVCFLMFSGCGIPQSETSKPESVESLMDIPAYTGNPYVVLNNNIPEFSKEDMNTTSFEYYSELDSLGRCGVAYANIGRDLMPTEKRQSIGKVKPTGWKTAKYDWVDGKYLYNRCHLLGFQLTGENANEKNLITGTRYLNVEGMLPFENMVADYIKETNNHVLYRVTPVYNGTDLVANGVVMEGKSVEDNGEGILFHVYCYNVQPNVAINYATGESRAAEDGNIDFQVSDATYILNISTKKFHLSTCPGLRQTKEKNKQEFHGAREELIKQGYEPCKTCHP